MRTCTHLLLLRHCVPASPQCVWTVLCAACILHTHKYTSVVSRARWAEQRPVTPECAVPQTCLSTIPEVGTAGSNPLSPGSLDGGDPPGRESCSTAPVFLQDHARWRLSAVPASLSPGKVKVSPAEKAQGFSRSGCDQEPPIPAVLTLEGAGGRVRTFEGLFKPTVLAQPQSLILQIRGGA